MNKFILVFSLILNCVAFSKPAPQFQGELIDGKRVSLKQSLKPGRALILCFWASWCTPCLQELKEISARLKKEPNLPIDMLAINVDTTETASDVRPTMRLYGFDFSTVMDPKHEIFSKYQSSKSLPFSAVVSPQSELAKTFSGYQEDMFDEAKKALGIENQSSEIKL